MRAREAAPTLESGCGIGRKRLLQGGGPPGPWAAARPVGGGPPAPYSPGQLNWGTPARAGKAVIGRASSTKHSSGPIQSAPAT